jgi:hypothetical protein
VAFLRKKTGTRAAAFPGRRAIVIWRAYECEYAYNSAIYYTDTGHRQGNINRHRSPLHKICYTSRHLCSIEPIGIATPRLSLWRDLAMAAGQSWDTRSSNHNPRATTIARPAGSS